MPGCIQSGLNSPICGLEISMTLVSSREADCSLRSQSSSYPITGIPWVCRCHRTGARTLVNTLGAVNRLNGRGHKQCDDPPTQMAETFGEVERLVSASRNLSYPLIPGNIPAGEKPPVTPTIPSGVFPAQLFMCTSHNPVSYL